MTREAQADRRRRMAEMVKGGRTVEQTAQVFEMSILTVQNACRVFGVDYKSKPNAANANPAASSMPVETATLSGAAPG